MDRINALENERARRGVNPTIHQERKQHCDGIMFARELNKSRGIRSIVQQVTDLIEFDVSCDSGIAPLASHRTYG